MSGEIFYSLAGTEAELRRLSAEDYLRAKTEAHEMGENYPADEEAHTLLLAACLVARGAYDGEKHIFSSPYEVLTALSADELLSAAAEYFPKDMKKAESFEDTYGENGQKAEDAGAVSAITESGAKNTAATASDEKTPDIPFRDHKETSEPYAEWRRTPAGGSVSVQYGGAEKERYYAPATSENAAADMYAVSDFFERDARRFPGGFDRF